MTLYEAMKTIEERLEIDRNAIDGEPKSDFDKFVAKQDEALEIALEALREKATALWAKLAKVDNALSVRQMAERLERYEKTGMDPEETIKPRISFEVFQREVEPLWKAKIEERIPGNVVYYLERDEETGELMVESVVSATGFFSTLGAAQRALRGIELGIEP